MKTSTMTSAAIPLRLQQALTALEQAVEQRLADTEKSHSAALTQLEDDNRRLHDEVLALRTDNAKLNALLARTQATQKRIRKVSADVAEKLDNSIIGLKDLLEGLDPA